MKSCNIAAYPIAKARGLRGGFSVNQLLPAEEVCGSPRIRKRWKRLANDLRLKDHTATSVEVTKRARSLPPPPL